MEFKGTKGEWYYEYDNSDNTPHEWYTIATETYGNILGRRYSDKSLTHLQMKANALLISKAPEMLEMLKFNCNILTNTLSYLSNIREQIQECDLHKFDTNYNLIDKSLKSNLKLIKSSTELKEV